MPALNVVTVDPDELEVDIDLSQRGGATVTAYTDATGATPISLPATISDVTQFWLPVNADYTFIVSVGGTERARTTIGVSDRGDDPKTLLLRNLLTLGDAAAGGGATSGASGPWVEHVLDMTLNAWTPDIGVWVAGHVYAVGDRVLGDGHEQIVATAGTSGGTEPTWDVLGGTTNDGPALVWQDDGATSTNGDWSSTGGVLSTTNATADSSIAYNTPLPSVVSIMETEVRIPSGQDGGTTGLAVLAVGNFSAAGQGVGTGNIVGEGVALQADAAGDGAVIKTGAWVDAGIVTGTLFGAAIPQDEWHTLRFVTDAFRRSVWLDGDYLFSDESVSGGNTSTNEVPPKSTDLSMFGAVGLVDFRNGRVWTLALPA